jgi:hypothetical protein
MTKPKTEEEVLKTVKAAATEGTLRFSSDALTSKYNEEIQRIFYLLRVYLRGGPPKRQIWVADGVSVGVVLDWTQEGGYSEDSLRVCKKVSEELGIEVTPDTLWEDAGACLRAINPKVVQ